MGQEEHILGYHRLNQKGKSDAKIYTDQTRILHLWVFKLYFTTLTLKCKQKTKWPYENEVIQSYC